MLIKYDREYLKRYLPELADSGYNGVEVETPVVENCAEQRKGKTTLMMADLLLKFLNPYSGYDYKPTEVYTNFVTYIDGINNGNNERMLAWLIQAKAEKWRHKIWLVDECSQPPLFYARNFKSVKQTELVTHLWQMPKKDNIFEYTSNPGTTVDVQQRDATWYTQIPTYYHHSEISRDLDYIEYTIVKNYEGWYKDDILRHVNIIQATFNTWLPVE